MNQLIFNLAVGIINPTFIYALRHYLKKESPAIKNGTRYMLDVYGVKDLLFLISVAFSLQYFDSYRRV